MFRTRCGSGAAYCSAVVGSAASVCHSPRELASYAVPQCRWLVGGWAMSAGSGGEPKQTAVTVRGYPSAGPQHPGRRAAGCVPGVLPTVGPCVAAFGVLCWAAVGSPGRLAGSVAFGLGCVPVGGQRVGPPALGACGVGSCEVWAPPDVTSAVCTWESWWVGRRTCAASLEFTRCFCSLWKCWALAPTAKPVARGGDTASVFPAREQHGRGPPCCSQVRHGDVSGEALKTPSLRRASRPTAAPARVFVGMLSPRWRASSCLGQSRTFLSQ